SADDEADLVVGHEVIADTATGERAADQLVGAGHYFGVRDGLGGRAAVQRVVHCDNDLGDGDRAVAVGGTGHVIGRWEGAEGNVHHDDQLIYGDIAAAIAVADT